jgi:hypothetical protein
MLRLDRLGKVLLADILASFQIGDGAGDLEDSHEGTCGKSQPVGDQFQHPVGRGVKFVVFPEVAGVLLGVAVNLRRLKPFHLEITGALHPAVISAELSALDRSAGSR